MLEKMLIQSFFWRDIEELTFLKGISENRVSANISIHFNQLFGLSYLILRIC